MASASEHGSVSVTVAGPPFVPQFWHSWVTTFMGREGASVGESQVRVKVVVVEVVVVPAAQVQMST